MVNELFGVFINIEGECYKIKKYEVELIGMEVFNLCLIFDRLLSLVFV